MWLNYSHASFSNIDISPEVLDFYANIPSLEL